VRLAHADRGVREAGRSRQVDAVALGRLDRKTQAELAGERGGRRRLKGPRWDAEGLQSRRLRCGGVHALGGLVDGQPAVTPVVPGLAAVGGERVMQGGAGCAQLEQHPRVRLRRLRRAGAPEQPQPAHQGKAHPRSDVEGARRVQHPAKTLAERPGMSERFDLAGHEQAAVREDSALRWTDLGLPFQERHGGAPLRQRRRDAGTDHTAAHDQHVLTSAHDVPLLTAERQGHSPAPGLRSCASAGARRRGHVWPLALVSRSPCSRRPRVSPPC